jgi:phosphoribosylglycinamide formyltransferase-1
LAVFASGAGTNLEALLAACADGRLPATAVGVVCNRPGAGAIARAERHGVPVLVCDHRDHAGREAHEEAILAWLRPLLPDWIALAGYMRLLSGRLLREYPGRVVNIHPADTRRHQGGGGYEWALREGLSATCVTVHHVDEGMDTGRIIAQAPVRIFPGDTLETLKERGLAVEHELYVEALAKLLAPGHQGVGGPPLLCERF